MGNTTKPPANILELPMGNALKWPTGGCWEGDWSAYTRWASDLYLARWQGGWDVGPGVARPL